MSKLYNFAVGSIEFEEDTSNFMEEMEKKLFRKVNIRAFASGPNAHTLPVDLDVLKKCAYTVYNKPIVWKYNPFTDDAMSHELEEVPCGFVPENESNPINFVEDMNKTFLVVDALIWTKYCGRLIEIFERDDKRKDISIEIAILEDETVNENKPKIKEFVVAGITILGEYINPAVKGCRAELLEFAQAKEEYLSIMNFDEKYIPIVNTKEASVNGPWSNPRRKLFTPIVEASNRKSLLKEAYLIGDFDSDNPEITKFKYPHHLVKNGKLVLQQRGVEAAFQRASQQGIVSGKVKAHLLRHYRELGLNTENFAEFGITKEDFNFYFAEEFSKNESVGDSSMADTAKEMDTVIENSDETNVECAENKEVECATTPDVECSEKEIHCDDDDDTKEEVEKDINRGEDKQVNKVAREERKETKEEIDDEEKKMSLEKAMAEIDRLTAKCAELESGNQAYMCQLKEFDELKKFKEETLARMAKEAEFAAMDKVMSELADRGIEMSEENKKELMGKFSEFSSIDAWTNMVKAYVLDMAENVGDVVRMGLPFKTSPQPVSSIWD